MSNTEKSGGGPLPEDHREINPATGQQKAYIVLTPEERAKGFVEPVRLSYTHLKCGTPTKMARDLAETYAREPEFYSGTFCAGCRAHFPLVEFVWEGTNQQVGTRRRPPAESKNQPERSVGSTNEGLAEGARAAPQLEPLHKLLEDAASMLDDFVKARYAEPAPSATIEQYPYLPAAEDVVERLREALHHANLAFFRTAIDAAPSAHPEPVALTDEQIEAICAEVGHEDTVTTIPFARAILATQGAPEPTERAAEAPKQPEPRETVAYEHDLGGRKKLSYDKASIGPTCYETRELVYKNEADLGAAAEAKTVAPVAEVVGFNKVGFGSLPIVSWNRPPSIGDKLYAHPSPPDSAAPPLFI